MTVPMCAVENCQLHVPNGRQRRMGNTQCRVCHLDTGTDLTWDTNINGRACSRCRTVARSIRA